MKLELHQTYKTFRDKKKQSVIEINDVYAITIDADCYQKIYTITGRYVCGISHFNSLCEADKSRAINDAYLLDKYERRYSNDLINIDN